MIRGFVVVIGFLAVVASSASRAESEVTYFYNRDAYADFEKFLGTKAGSTAVFVGTTKEGKACQFTIVQGRELMLITPLVEAEKVEGDYPRQAYSIDFRVPKGVTTSIDGGFQGDELWSSYFLDRKSGSRPILHGQFGISFSIRLSRNARGELTHFTYFKVRHDDLNYHRLASLDCTVK